MADLKMAVMQYLKYKTLFLPTLVKKARIPEKEPSIFIYPKLYNKISTEKLKYDISLMSVAIHTLSNGGCMSIQHII